MKQIFMALMSIFFFSKCNDVQKDLVRAFIEGSYASSYSTAYSKGKDTLQITELSKTGNNYSITRSVSYQRIRNGKTLPKESKQEQWLCIYDADDKVLYETRTGKVISFIPEKDILLVGNKQYQKIKDDYLRNFKLPD